MTEKIGNEDNVSEDDFFTSDEKRLNAKTMKVREMIIDDMTDGGENVPTSTGEIRVLKEVIESIDKKIVDTANIRAKREGDKAMSGLGTAIADVLKANALNKEKAIRDTIVADIEVPDDFMPDDVVPGEMEIDADELTLEQFTEDKE